MNFGSAQWLSTAFPGDRFPSPNASGKSDRGQHAINSAYFEVVTRPLLRHYLEQFLHMYLVFTLNLHNTPNLYPTLSVHLHIYHGSQFEVGRSG